MIVIVGTSSMEDSSSSLSLLYEPLTKELDRMCRHYNDNKGNINNFILLLNRTVDLMTL